MTLVVVAAIPTAIAIAALLVAHGTKKLQLRTTQAETWRALHAMVIDLYRDGVASAEIAALLANPSRARLVRELIERFGHAAIPTATSAR